MEKDATTFHQEINTADHAKQNAKHYYSEDAEDAINQLHAMIAECWPDSVLDGVDAHETENGDIWGEWSEGSLGRNRGLLMKLQGNS